MIRYSLAIYGEAPDEDALRTIFENAVRATREATEQSVHGSITISGMDNVARLDLSASDVEDTPPA